MSALTVRTTDLREQPQAPDWWHLLAGEAPNVSAFLLPAWVNTWLASYGSAFRGRWVSFWVADRCVAGALLLDRWGRVGPVPIRLATVNTAAEDAEESPWIEHNDVLCLQGMEGVVASALSDLLRNTPWDRLLLNGYRPGGVMAQLGDVKGDWHAETEWKSSPYVDLASLDDRGIEPALSSNSRSQIRRSIKLYSARGELRVAAAESADEAKTFLHELALLHRKGFSQRGREGGFRTQRFIHFHRALIDSLWPSAAVAILRVSSGDTPFAYLYNFVHHRRVYFYQCGFEYLEDPKLKPGLVAHFLAINYFIPKGMVEYDFMAGDARYKLSLANAERKLGWTRIERQSLLMRTLQRGREVRNRWAALRGTGRSASVNERAD